MTLINTNFMANWPYVKSRGREQRKKEADKTSPPPNISPMTLTMALNLVREDKDDMHKREGMNRSLLAEKSIGSKNGSRSNYHDQLSSHKKKVSMVQDLDLKDDHNDKSPSTFAAGDKFVDTIRFSAR